MHAIGQALLLAAGMFWQVAWSLVLGFFLSAAIQTLVSKERMTAQLGRNGLREIALATAYGAASSSCSYAAAAMSKTLFKKGAGFIPSLAFLFASTNLVVELGIILYLLMGWQFTAAEWIGGVLLIAIMALIVKATYPLSLIHISIGDARVDLVLIARHRKAAFERFSSRRSDHVAHQEYIQCRYRRAGAFAFLRDFKKYTSTCFSSRKPTRLFDCAGSRLSLIHI